MAGPEGNPAAQDRQQATAAKVGLGNLQDFSFFLNDPHHHRQACTLP